MSKQDNLYRYYKVRVDAALRGKHSATVEELVAMREVLRECEQDVNQLIREKHR